jgi:hypothetical protein
MNDIVLIAAETSEKVRYANVPYIQLRLNGDSYLNAMAARILGFDHGDVLKFYHSEDLQRWHIANDPVSGAVIKKKSGLFKFCSTKTVRQIFQAYQIEGTRANFPISPEIQKVNGIPTLWMIPKPYNITP